jgi:hypothetical protein
MTLAVGGEDLEQGTRDFSNPDTQRAIAEDFLRKLNQRLSDITIFGSDNGGLNKKAQLEQVLCTVAGFSDPPGQLAWCIRLRDVVKFADEVATGNASSFEGEDVKRIKQMEEFNQYPPALDNENNFYCNLIKFIAQKVTCVFADGNSHSENIQNMFTALLSVSVGGVVASHTTSAALYALDIKPFFESFNINDIKFNVKEFKLFWDKGQHKQRFIDFANEVDNKGFDNVSLPPNMNFFFLPNLVEEKFYREDTIPKHIIYNFGQHFKNNTNDINRLSADIIANYFDYTARLSVYTHAAYKFLREGVKSGANQKYKHLEKFLKEWPRRYNLSSEVLDNASDVLQYLANVSSEAAVGVARNACACVDTAAGGDTGNMEDIRNHDALEIINLMEQGFYRASPSTSPSPISTRDCPESHFGTVRNPL